MNVKRVFEIVFRPFHDFRAQGVIGRFVHKNTVAQPFLHFKVEFLNSVIFVFIIGHDFARFIGRAVFNGHNGANGTIQPKIISTG